MPKNIYEQIKSELVIKLLTKRKKIEILDELRNSKKPATAEQYKILNEPEGRLSSVGISLILEAKSNVLKKSGIDYQPILIDHEYNFCKLESTIEKN